MEKLRPIKFQWSSFVWLSLVYIAVYSITVGLVLPLQSKFIPAITDYIGLAFLPHGVRILAFYLFGLSGAVYLLPASYLMLFILEQKGVDLNLTLPLVSMLACYFGYWTVRALIFDGKSPPISSAWAYFFAVGLSAATFNGLSMSYFQTGSIIILDLLAIIIGDMVGMFICIIGAIYFFRLARLVGPSVDK